MCVRAMTDSNKRPLRKLSEEGRKGLTTGIRLRGVVVVEIAQGIN